MNRNIQTMTNIMVRTGYNIEAPSRAPGEMNRLAFMPQGISGNCINFVMAVRVGSMLSRSRAVTASSVSAAYINSELDDAADNVDYLSAALFNRARPV